MSKKYPQHSPPQFVPYYEAAAQELQKQLNIQPVFCQLLVQRGIYSLAAARDYFRPQLADLPSPFLMRDMDKAVLRLKQAVDKQEKIVIYGDYDVDGTTSVALLVSFLRPYNPHVHFYLPDRHDEGYGISQKGVEWAKTQGAGLIIALDCGINAVEEVVWAKNEGMDFIICDHHLPPDTLPEALAILNPKQKGCAYPCKELCGAAIGFKLLQGFLVYNNMDLNSLWAHLDLVALALAADYVDLRGENRILAYHGLRQLNDAPRLGLATLKSVLVQPEDNSTLDIHSLVFKFGPLINAAGRIEHAREAVQLFLSDSEIVCNLHSNRLLDLNEERRNLEKTASTQARAQLLALPDWENLPIFILYQSDWHKGVLGIIAARIVEEFARPAIILCQSNGLWVGSARTVGNFDIHAALSHCSDDLHTYGGHRAAAGLSLEIQQLANFINSLTAYAELEFNPDTDISPLWVDAELNLAQINDKFYNLLAQFAPFGPANMRPVFYARQLRAHGLPKLLKQTHLKFQLETSPNELIEVIGFNLGEHFELIQQGQPFDMAFVLQENYFKGKRRLQLEARFIGASER